MKKRWIFYIAVGLGFFLIGSTLFPLVSNGLQLAVSPQYLLVLAGLCLLVLGLTKKRLTAGLVFLMMGIGVSFVILLLFTIDGS